MASNRPVSASVLLIDDEPDAWPMIISDIVRPVECRFNIRTNDGLTVGWVTETNVGDLCDLVICNLKNRAKGQFYGKIIIRELRTRFPNLPILVLTGEDPESAKELHKLYTDLYAKYKVTYVAFKRADDSSDEKFDLDMFRDKFFEALQSKQGPIDSIAEPTQHLPSHIPNLALTKEENSGPKDELETLPPGVIGDILEGLKNSSSSIDIGSRYRDEFSHLASASEDRRIHFAVKAWKRLWLEEDGLPYLTLIDKLAEDEFSGEFYSEYRDHVAHSVWVYLLGLYLYQHNGPIREAIGRNFTGTSFLRAWKTAALFHDIGYTCDRGIDKEDEFIQPVLTELQRFTDFPLLEHLKPRGFVLDEGDEEHLAQIGTRHTPLKLTLDSIEFRPLPLPDQPLLDIVEHLIVPTKLGQSTQAKPLQSYYLLGKTVQPKPNELKRFRDHGVLSALLLLHQFDRLDHCLKSLRGKSLPERLARETQTKLAELVSGTTTEPGTVTERYAEAVFQAAAAMALHNVNIDIWDHGRAKRYPYYLSFVDYGIALEDNPLAFLLAFCDVLQCWDRPKRRYVIDEKDFAVRARDVRIVCDGDRILWTVAPDPNAEQQLVKPGKEIKAMSRYMLYRGKRDLSPLITEMPA